MRTCIDRDFSEPVDLTAGMTAGLWTLTERIGRGGMAEVWRGVADDSPDVAIKLMPKALGQDAVFESEAAALARMVHPRIIRILDFGVTGPASGAQPYLALELARGPSMDRWLGSTPIGWNDVLDVARRVLEALAHAHSRGLVHRDIKPANILAMDVAGTDWRLTDFGIARTYGGAGDEHNPSGTPPYMAPEQFAGRLRDQGPWTDLYSLACVLYEMLTGHPPFDGDSFIQFAFKHMSEAAPPLAARIEVPEGLDALLRVLLRKDPLARFRSAADALRAFEKLPRLRATQPTTPLHVGYSADTYVTPAFAPTITLGDLEGFEWSPAAEDEAPVIEASPPPAEPPASSPRHYFATFHGDTGPGLIGLREVPFVGRLSERTVIWDRFRECVTRRVRRTVVVRGPEGIGKTAIGRWLTQAVTEHGFATAVRIEGSHETEEALLSAISTTYRLNPMSADEAAVRLRRWATPPDWAVETLARGVTGGAGPGEDVIGAALAMLWAHAERKPVVLWIDDADEQGRRALVERVAALGFADVRVLVVAAMRAEYPSVSAVVDDDLVMGAFAPGECAELVTELVGMEAEVAFAVARAVDGNPQYTVEVVRDWMARGLLVRTAGRWAVRGGRLPELPSSVGAVRFQQFESLVAGSVADRHALELLACYGPECPHRDWAHSCVAARITPSAGLIVRAMRAGLVEQRDKVLHFTDGVLQRRLVKNAAEGGRRVAFHRAIAEIVRHAPERYSAALIGTHLFEAGEFEASLAPLREAGRKSQRGDIVDHAELMDRYDAAVEALDAVDSEHGWWGRFARARLLANQWKGTAAAEELKAVIATAREREWAALECETAIAYSHLVSARAPVLDDAVIAARAVELADQLGNRVRSAQSRSAAGALCGYLGQIDAADRYYSEAREIAVELGDVSERADADYGLGWVYFLQGRLDHALAPLHQAIAAMESVGRIRSAHVVRSFTGDVLRALGRLDEAEAAFTAAYQYLSRYHQLEAVMPANFAMLEVARGRLEDALRWARRAREIESTRGRLPIIAVTYAVELLYAARHRDEVAWDEAFRVLRDDFGIDANYDVAYVTDTAARETSGTMDPERARAIVELAIAQWTRLGRVSEAEALQSLL